MNWTPIILFYSAIILFLILQRKNITRHGIIFLYRRKWGLKWMNKFSEKYREWIILLGYVGVGAGYVGLLIISYALVKNLWDLLLKPEALSGVSLVLPGVNVPGLGILPFWYWIIAIFIIALVHEAGHGIVARAHKITVKNTGIVLFGPILGAFVEPDEKEVSKQSDIKQYSVLAAGAFMNILLAIGAALLLNFAITPIQETMTAPNGFSFSNYDGTQNPAENINLPLNTPITSIGNIPTETFQSFQKELTCKKPGDTIELQAAGNIYPLTLTSHPQQPSSPYMGISEIKNEFNILPEYQTGWKNIFYLTISWLAGFLRWLFVLSLGIGLFNLLPLPIVDGGRMAQVFLHKLKEYEMR